MNTWDTLWVVEWHEAGALFITRLSDAVSRALVKRKGGEPVKNVIVGVAGSLDDARELEREIKRERRGNIDEEKG